MKLKKILALALAAVLLVAVGVGGTLAWLVAQSNEVKNTFTYGKVALTLDEAQVEYDPELNEYVEKDDHSRTTTNEYKILPGVKIAKDPTVTVTKDSEDCYVRAIITVTSNQAAYALMNNDPKSWIDDLENDYWKYEGTAATTIDDENDVVTTVYEVRYVGVLDADKGAGIVPYDKENNQTLKDIFTSVTIPADIDEEEIIDAATVKIDVIAHAMQAGGFDNAAAAWAAYDQQMNP